MRQQLQVREDQLNTKLDYHGLYLGIVEDTTDPMNLGRCRIRIPDISGGLNDTPINNLPWASPCFAPWSFNVPQVGDQVWILFIQGNIEYPVYMGWCPSIPSSPQVRARVLQKGALSYQPSCPTVPISTPSSIVNDQKNFVAQSTGVDISTLSSDPSTVSESAYRAAAQIPESAGNLESYITPPDTEVQPECRTRSSPDPVVHQIFKSKYGHSVFYSDDPGCEYLKIIDRLGQEIHFDCPVTFENNIHNRNSRGTGEAELGTQIPQQKVVNQTARIQITDNLGQLIEMYASEEGGVHNSEVHLVGQDSHFIRIVSGRYGFQRVESQTKSGHQLLLSDDGNECKFYHKSGSIVHLRSNGDVFIENSSGNHQVLMDSTNIILAFETVNKRLVWLDSMISKYNSHTHGGVQSGGSSTSTPTPQFDSTDGTTVTLAG